MSDNWLPYGWHWLDDDDIAAVTKILRHGHLTQGETIAEFERAVATFAAPARSGCQWHRGIALRRLRCRCWAGDEAITSPLTFAATANCIAYQVPARVCRHRSLDAQYRSGRDQAANQ
jgi:dTDP-4-amino-4,6-dideoxygalactose transaminase